MRVENIVTVNFEDETAASPLVLLFYIMTNLTSTVVIRKTKLGAAQSRLCPSVGREILANHRRILVSQKICRQLSSHSTGKILRGLFWCFGKIAISKNFMRKGASRLS